MGNLVENPFDRTVAQRLLTLVFRRTLLPRKLSRLAEANDSRHVLRRRALAALLLSAINQVLDLHPFANVQKPDAFRPVQLMGACAHKVDAQILHANVFVAIRLHSVGMEQYAMLAGDAGKLGNGLDGADFVVGVHDGGKNGIGTNGLFKRDGIDQAEFIDGKIGDLKALFLKSLACMKHGMMLDSARDNMPALASRRSSRALHGPVVGLGA